MFTFCFSYIARLYEKLSPSELFTRTMHHLALGTQIQNAFILPTAQGGFDVATVDRKASPMITWNTNFTRMTLSIWEDVGRGAYDGLKYAETEAFDNINAWELQYPWDLLYSLQTSPSTDWYLSIKDESGSGEVFNSTYFLFDDLEKSYTEQELRKRAVSTNTFISPPPTDLNDPIAKDYSLNPNYADGSSFTITWNTNLSSYGLAYWQDLPCNPKCSNGPTYLQESLTDDSPQSFQWTVSPDPYSLTASNVFWFALYENVDGQFSELSPPIHAHYFNITIATSTTTSSTSTTLTTASTTKTSSLSTTTTTTTTTISTSSTSQSSSGSSPTSQISTTPRETVTSTSASPQSTSSSSSSSSAATISASSKKSSSLSTGAKIGIALGSIAIVALFAFIGYAAYRYGQRKANTETGSNTLPHTMSPNVADSISGGFFGSDRSGGGYEPNSAYPRSVGEMSGYSEGSIRQTPVAEMGSGRYSTVPGRGRVIVHELPGRI